MFPNFAVVVTALFVVVLAFFHRRFRGFFFAFLAAAFFGFKEAFKAFFAGFGREFNLRFGSLFTILLLLGVM